MEGCVSGVEVTGVWRGVLVEWRVTDVWRGVLVEGYWYVEGCVSGAGVTGVWRVC